MKKAGILLLLLPFFGCTTTDTSIKNDFLSYTQIVFASGIDAEEYLRTEDAFLLNLSPFDRSARLKTSREIDNVGYLDFISGQVRDWTAAEKEKINQTMITISLALLEFNLVFPQEIVFIKTTGIEEGNAAYCRGNNVIVLPQDYVNLPVDRLYNLILHELFHIYSRNNTEIQERLYGLLSYQKCKELQLPNDIFRWKITNPDAAVNNYFFSANINGADYNLMPILLTSSNYEEEKGGDFFDYMELYFIAVTEDENAMVPLKRNDVYVLFTKDHVPDYIEFVSRNTDYIIHPEEILASNFVLMVNKRNVPDMELIGKIKAVLKPSF